MHLPHISMTPPPHHRHSPSLMGFFYLHKALLAPRISFLGVLWGFRGQKRASICSTFVGFNLIFQVNKNYVQIYMYRESCAKVGSLMGSGWRLELALDPGRNENACAMGEQQPLPGVRVEPSWPTAMDKRGWEDPPKEWGRVEVQHGMAWRWAAKARMLENTDHLPLVLWDCRRCLARQLQSILAPALWMSQRCRWLRGQRWRQWNCKWQRRNGPERKAAGTCAPYRLFGEANSMGLSRNHSGASCREGGGSPRAADMWVGLLISQTVNNC